MFAALAQATQPALEIITQTREFFTQVWMMLMGIVTLVGALVFLLVPWLLERSRARSFKLSEQAVLDRVEDLVEDLGFGARAGPLFEQTSGE